MAFPINHDMHCHSCLSTCARDPRQTVEAILGHAKQQGYDIQCITDHLWDSMAPGASRWYERQNIEHVKKNLPLPEDDQVRLVFGCETEYCGGGKIGLTAENYDQFDFIVVPPTHFHMKGFVRPECYETEEQLADLLVERLEEIAQLNLPWHKVGIAHINGLILPEGKDYLVFRYVDEKRFRAVMRKYAELGAGIEINLSCFKEGWLEVKEDHLRLFRMAKEEGCKFYLASDAHKVEELSNVQECAPLVCELLELDECDRFILK